MGQRLALVIEKSQDSLRQPIQFPRKRSAHESGVAALLREFQQYRR